MPTRSQLSRKLGWIDIRTTEMVLVLRKLKNKGIHSSTFLLPSEVHDSLISDREASDERRMSSNNVVGRTSRLVIAKMSNSGAIIGRADGRDPCARVA